MMNESAGAGLYDVTSSSSHGNLTDSFPVHVHHPVTTFIETYSIPVLCLLGLIGNSLASIVFFQKQLRNSSSSIFLATRGLSDNGFLSTLLIIWLSRTFQLQLGGVPGACRVIIFLTYVCGCISVWLVVFVTFENYIRICRPFIVNRVCKTSTAKLAVLVLIIFAVGLYNFPFWAMSGECKPYQEHYNLVQALVYTDTVVTLVMPLICITVLMAAIVYDLVKSYNRRSKLHAPTVKRMNNPMAKVTKMLLAVTVTFFCLNLPSHVNRLRIMISSFLLDSDNTPSGESYLDEEAIMYITLFMSYLSLTINIVVYITFGSKFRTVFIELITCRFCSTLLTFSRQPTNASSRELCNGNQTRTNTCQATKEVVIDYSETTHLNAQAENV